MQTLYGIDAAKTSKARHQHLDKCEVSTCDRLGAEKWRGGLRALSMEGPDSLLWPGSVCRGEPGKGGDWRCVKPPLYIPPACSRVWAAVMINAVLTLALISLFDLSSKWKDVHGRALQQARPYNQGRRLSGRVMLCINGQRRRTWLLCKCSRSI